MSDILDMYIKNNKLVQDKVSEPISPIDKTDCAKSYQAKDTAAKTPILQNNLSKDTYDKNDKTKKIVKYGAIGAGIAAIAYSTFALIKYGKTSSNPIEALKEPVKVLLARINPNGFKPSVSIEEDKDKYIGEIGYHLKRLKENQKEKFINNLYSKTNFTEQSRQKFIEIYGEYLER